MPHLSNCLALTLSVGFSNLLSAQHYKAELLSHEYFVVQHGDTIQGYYDTLDLKDGNFGQYIQTTFSGVGDRKLHMKGDSSANANDRVEIQTHVTVSGALGNGVPIGEWLFRTSNFKNYTTFYGDLNWKRINYESTDTTFVHVWNGSDYFNKSGRLLGGERFCCSKGLLFYRCINGKCTIEEEGTERRIEVAPNEVEMTLDRISLFGF